MHCSVIGKLHLGPVSDCDEIERLAELLRFHRTENQILFRIVGAATGYKRQMAGNSGHLFASITDSRP